MASDTMWGGLPFIVPSGTAMKYLYHSKVINEEDVPVGAHYRAREDMLNNVRFSKNSFYLHDYYKVTLHAVSFLSIYNHYCWVTAMHFVKVVRYTLQFPNHFKEQYNSLMGPSFLQNKSPF